MTTHRGRPPNQTKTLHKPSSKNEIVNMYKLNESVTYNDIGETDDAFCFYKGRVDIKRGIEANYNQIIGNECRFLFDQQITFSLCYLWKRSRPKFNKFEQNIVDSSYSSH